MLTPSDKSRDSVEGKGPVEPRGATHRKRVASGTARQRRKDARPQELLDAALDLFVEKGFAATRSEEVAARAGVSKGTLYLYYQSKEELLKAVILQTISREIAEGMDIIDSYGGPSADLLKMLLNEWWSRVGEQKASGICKLMVAEARNFPDIARFYLDEVITPGRLLISRVLQRGIDSGEFRAIPVDDAVGALIAPMLYLMVHQHSVGLCEAVNELFDPRRIIAAELDLVLHGLLPRA
ncbi:MAG: transcriptional regulator, TetR family [Rhizobacter sp.]|nr:transcriptional regulator, TetR family [Rhizobacter sp.]